MWRVRERGCGRKRDREDGRKREVQECGVCEREGERQKDTGREREREKERLTQHFWVSRWSASACFSAMPAATLTRSSCVCVCGVKPAL